MHPDEGCGASTDRDSGNRREWAELRTMKKLSHTLRTGHRG